MHVLQLNMLIPFKILGKLSLLRELGKEICTLPSMIMHSKDTRALVTNAFSCMDLWISVILPITSGFGPFYVFCLQKQQKIPHKQHNLSPGSS